MNTKILKYCLFALLLVNHITTYSQSEKSFLISENQNDFINKIIISKKSQQEIINIADGKSLYLKLNVQKQEGQDFTLIGSVNGQKQSTFTFSKINGKLEGTIVMKEAKIAYELFTKKNEKVYIKEIDINKILCIELDKVDPKSVKDTGTTFSKMAPLLESLPGAPGVVYLDFDGEVVSGTSWVNGGTINAVSPNFSDQKIVEVWKIMAEDFRPFNMNVTTDRSVFEATPKNRRMMCIFTPTNDAAPGSGGVAYVNSFSRSNDNPCWVYNLSTRAAGETGSHEVGHTLGLSHDGINSTTYYNGHGQWSPIMGWSASRPIGQWSAGEYNDSTSSQDDIAIIANDRNGIGFQNDDHGNSINEATSILVAQNGNVNPDQNFGLISQRTDKDVFSFVVETGNVSFDFDPDPDYPNLNIQARILNALGEEVAFSDPNGLSASINTQLTDGTYFIEIDGVGEGANPSIGYTDYASLGNYTISGQYIPGDNNQPPLSNFEAITNCAVVTFTSTSVNKVDSYLWDFGDGITSTEQNPVHEYTTSGNYTILLTTTNNLGQDTEEKVDFITVNIPGQPMANNQNICTGESATITMTGSNNYEWYDAPTEGNLIVSGSTYETPVLTSTQTYYVQGINGSCITKTRTLVNINVSDNCSVYTFSPNPLKSDETLLIQGLTMKENDIRIVNSIGRLISIFKPNGELDMSELSSGLYFILIDNKSIGKLVKL